MKIILSLFLVSLFTHPAWINDSDSLIKKIDADAELIEISTLDADYEIVNYRKSTLKKYIKTECFLKSTTLETLKTEHTVYQENTFIFASYDYSILPILHKGKNTSEPDFVIEETKNYFKTKKNGIQYMRSINGFGSNNIDSLKIELTKISFDERPLTKDDYLKEVDYFKRTKKLFR